MNSAHQRQHWQFGLVLLTGLAFVAAAPTAAWAQGAVGGVHVDPHGVIAVRKKGGDEHLQQVKRNRGKDGKGALAYISLPKLFAEAQALLKAGKPLPEQMRYLDGMVKLQYVFADPDAHDLVIAGPAEAYDATNPARPLGIATGRPVLRLDDLVVALRSVGPGGTSRAFGCSLDLTKDALDRLIAAGNRMGGVRPGAFTAAAKQLVQATGPQDVRIFGVPPGTRFAFVCVEADYLMKRIALGLDNPGVKGVRSHLSLMKNGESMYNRYWFTPFYEPLLVSTDERAFEIRGQGLRIRVTDSLDDNGTGGSPSARKFVEQMTDHFRELAAVIPAFADLWNLADLSVLAALIAHDRLDEKCGVDLKWLADPAGYVVPETVAPTTAETLANVRQTGHTLTLAVGGVECRPMLCVLPRNRSADKSGQLRKLARHVDSKSWSLRVEKPDASVQTAGD